MVLKQKEFKVGGFAVTDFKEIEDHSLRTDAGPFHIAIHDNKVYIWGKNETGDFKKRKVDWRAEYREWGFWFIGGVKKDEIEVPVYPMRDGLYFSAIWTVSSGREEYLKELGIIGVRDVLIKKGICKGEANTLLNVQGVKELLELCKRMPAERAGVKEYKLEELRKLIEYESAIKEAAALAEDARKLEEHPDVRNFLRKKAMPKRLR